MTPPHWGIKVLACLNINSVAIASGPAIKMRGLRALHTKQMHWYKYLLGVTITTATGTALRRNGEQRLVI